MAVRVGDTLKPMNGLDFPVVDASDVSIGNQKLDSTIIGMKTELSNADNAIQHLNKVTINESSVTDNVISVVYTEGTTGEEAPIEPVMYTVPEKQYVDDKVSDLSDTVKLINGVEIKNGTDADTINVLYTESSSGGTEPLPGVNYIIPEKEYVDDNDAALQKTINGLNKVKMEYNSEGNSVINVTYSTGITAGSSVVPDVTYNIPEKAYVDDQIFDLNKIELDLDKDSEGEFAKTFNVKYSDGGELPGTIINDHIPNKEYVDDIKSDVSDLSNTVKLINGVEILNGGTADCIRVLYTENSSGGTEPLPGVNYVIPEKEYVDDKVSDLTSRINSANSIAISDNENNVLDVYYQNGTDDPNDPVEVEHYEIPTKTYVDNQIANVNSLDVAYTDSQILNLNKITIGRDLDEEEEYIESLYVQYRDGGELPAHIINERVPTKTYMNNLLNGKQNALVSGTNIKTVNGQSLLGTGNIETTNRTEVQSMIDASISNIDIATEDDFEEYILGGAD